MDAEPALDWAPAALAERLRAVLPAIDVRVLASADSTSTRLLESIRGGDLRPCLLVAEHQTAGRGRNGRRWLSQPGASLTFSLALPLAPRDWSGLSLAVGVALAEAIEPPLPGQPPRLQLKWPNDLWLADGAGGWAKLGGVLVETVSGAAARPCVVGVGINVAPQPVEGAGSGYVHLQELLPGIDAPTLLAIVAPPLLHGLLRFESEGLAPFAAAYARRDLLSGRPITTTLPALAEGEAIGIDDGGALLVRREGTVHRLVSGEVSVRPRQPTSSEVT